MARQVRLLICVAALCAGACVFARPDPDYYVDTIIHNDVKSQQSDVSVWGHESDTKKINKKYPHAVLFGETCGGTIIGPKWVLTAAHCTLFTAGKYVLAGTGKSDDGSGITRYVKKLYVHRRFAVGPYWLNANRYDIKQVGARFDFLLAELDEPLPINNDTIAVARLNEEPTLPEGLRVTYAGYGAAHHGEVMRHDMHAMKLSLLSDEGCKFLEEYDSEDMICAKGRPPRYDSACNGDSGSGLVDDNGVLVGIASWVENDAIECRNGAVLYGSRVSVAREWIRKITGI